MERTNCQTKPVLKGREQTNKARQERKKIKKKWKGRKQTNKQR